MLRNRAYNRRTTRRRPGVHRTTEINMADTTDSNKTASSKYGKFSAIVILKADGSNYVNWSTITEVLIRAEKETYWSVVTNTGTPADDLEEGSQFCRYIILHSIDPTIIRTIYRGKTDTERTKLNDVHRRPVENRTRMRRTRR